MSGGIQLPPCPASLKSIQHYLKTATEHDARDEVVAYWCRLYSLQSALKIDKKSDDARNLLVRLMDWLEQKKKDLASNEAITNEVAAQAHIENYVLKIFEWATKQDQQSNYNKNVVKSYYTAGILMDVLNTFGDLSEEMATKCKFAKWRAAHIHSCLKNGEVPDPADFGEENLGEDDDILNMPTASNFTDPSENAGASGFTMPNFPEPMMPPQPSFTSPNNPPKFSQAGFSIEPINPANVPNQSPVAPTAVLQPVQPVSPSIPAGVVKLDPTKTAKAQKYCKWAESALNYDDVPEAISNLEKALHLLRTGSDV